jgi:hypothetical protein
MNIQRFSSLCLLSASLLLASSALAQDEDVTDVTDVTANIAPTPLTLINGWSRYTGGSAPAQVEKVGGIVHFKGGISTSGTIDYPFVLPAGFRPANLVEIPVDMSNGENGRLIISPGGSVHVEAEHSFSYAKVFTSLDGASFATSTSGFTPLTLINGWVPFGFGAGKPAVTLVNGIVHFEGAIATSGTNAYAFVLPKKFRPSHYVYAHVDMCNATNGRLWIAPSGYVLVRAENNFGNAQCFTSLDGVWFAQTNSGFTALSPVNGWIDGPESTSPAEAARIGGIVHLKGSLASGTSATLFYMPPNLRPSTFVYVPIDLCGATKGRLTFYPSGAVLVLAETDFGNAQCFTSLDGASFVQ